MESLTITRVFIFGLVMCQIYLVATCPQRCLKNGSSCSISSPQRCCSVICKAGICAAPCLQNDNICTDGSTCCSLLCDPITKKCANCLQNDNSCTDGSQCCSTLCDPIAKKCATCLQNDNACTDGSQCCSTLCDPIAKKCATCLQDDNTCTADTQCCSETCFFGICLIH